MVLFYLALSLVSMIGWTRPENPENLKSQWVYLVLSMLFLTAATYLSLKSQ